MILKNYSEKSYEMFDITFRGTSDFVSHLKSAPTAEVFASANLASKRSNDDSIKFTKTGSLEQAIEMFEYGWNDGFDSFLSAKKQLDKIFPHIAKKLVLQNNVVGSIPNVFNAINNIPLSMRKKVLEEKKNVISMNVDVSYPWFINSQQLFNFGAIVLSCIDFFESMGYRVCLNFFEIARSGNQMIYIKNTLKEDGAKSNMQKLYFPFCHSSYLRRLLFRVLETTDGLGYHWMSGYGYIMKINEIREALDISAETLLFSLYSMGIEGKDIVEDAQRVVDCIKLGDYLNINENVYTVCDNHNVLTKKRK